MKNPYKTLASKIIYHNQWLTVREDQIIQPDGAPGIYSVVESPPAALIVAIHNDQVYLLEMYRYAIQKSGLEVPAGSIEKNETPLTAARRELREETGMTATKWVELGAYYGITGYGTALSYIFLAQELSQDPDFTPPIAEAITEIIKFPLSEIESLINSGQIQDGQTAFALLLALRKLND